MARRLWIALAVVLGVGTLARAADWPQWRGPTRDGVAADATLPAPWPESLERLWQLEVGLGHSSPVVAGGKLVQHARQGDREVVQCVDAASGKVLWRDAQPAGPFEPRPVARRHGKGPFATPAVAGGKAYALGVSGELTCLELATGKRLWRRTFQGDHGKTYPVWGAASSPLLDAGRCILAVGTDKDGALVALDAGTGKTLWALSDDGPAYASPLVAGLAGKRQVVTLTHSRACGVDVEAGTLLWKMPFKTRHDMNIITPVIHGDLVVYSGYQEPTVALRIAADGDRLAVSEAWRNETAAMFMSSPVRHGQHLYGLAQKGKGTLVCIALADGATAWESPKGMGEYASLVRVGDKLLVLATKGDLLVVAADPSACKELGRSHLTDRPVWAHLALAGGRIYVKDKTHLACFALRGE